MIYDYANYLDILDYINFNIRWVKKEEGKYTFTTDSSVSYRKSYGTASRGPAVYELGGANDW